jgi:soluble lytic murein transglycosylase-like protein
MVRDTRAFVIAGSVLAITLAGATLTRHYIAAASEEDADRLSRAILEHVVRKNPEVTRELFRDFPMVLVTEARRTGIDHCLALAQAEVESEFRPDAVGTSGEVGLYQILPSTAALFERELGRFRRPIWERGKRDLGDLANPVISTQFAMAYLRDIMTRRPTVKEALIEYNGGPAGRHPRYYQVVMGAYVDLLEHPELRCRFQPVPQTASLMAFLTRG